MNARCRLALLACITVLFTGMTAAAQQSPAKLRVLIFSGQNNHDWRKTTPVLKQILTNGGFEVDVSEHPEQCNAVTFGPFDCIVSNWNNWNNFGRAKVGVSEWPEQTRKDFLDFVRNGHGFVVVHAGGASFLEWPEFQKLIGGTWGKTTGHGHIHAFEVKFADPAHPITKGLAPFTTTDELWHRMAIQPEKKILATAFSAKEQGGSGQDEPVAMTTEFGRGRCFNLVLGHDVKAMENAGFQELLVRGVQWAATGKVVAYVGPTMDSLPKELAQYKFGDDRAFLLAAERLTLNATDESLRKALAAEYAAMLTGCATVDGKRFICRQLGLIGMVAEVPVLEGLLADEQFAFAARSALERIPGDEALAALRRASEKAKGLAKAGLIQSLGVRRDPQALSLLKAALGDSDHVVVSTAVTSLGQIGGEEAMNILISADRQLPADLRPQFQEALLLIAKDFQAKGRTQLASMALTCASLSAMVSTAESSVHFDHPTQMHGALLLTAMDLLGDKGSDLCIDSLARKVPKWQSAAIRALHLDPKENLLKKLADKFASLTPGVQFRVVQALSDTRQPAALPIVAQAVASEDLALHQAGLAALGGVGNASSVPMLVDALQSDDKDLVKQVEAGLSRLRGPGVDAALMASLERSSVTTKAKIIRALAARSAKEAVPALLTLAQSQDARVRAEAIRALGALADGKVGLQIIELLDRSPDRTAVEAALVSVYRSADMVDPLIQALEQASGPRKASLVAVLSALGGPKARGAVHAALKTGDADTQRAAVRGLADWSDGAALDDLLAEAAATQDAAIKAIALRGVANQAPLAADRTPNDRVAVLRKAIALSDSKEQIKPILSALGKIRCRAAAQLAAGYLKDPLLRDEAALAVVEIAEALGPQAAGQISAELSQARAACENPVINARLKAIP